MFNIYNNINKPTLKDNIGKYGKILSVKKITDQLDKDLSTLQIVVVRIIEIKLYSVEFNYNDIYIQYNPATDKTNVTVLNNLQILDPVVADNTSDGTIDIYAGGTETDALIKCEILYGDLDMIIPTLTRYNDIAKATITNQITLKHKTT